MFNFIKEIRKTDRGKIIFKLTLYMIFFIIVFVLVIIASKIDNNTSLHKSSFSNSSTESIIKEKTYLDKQKLLFNGSYNFIYTIEGTTNVKFTGTCKDSIIEGFKETEKEIIKYRIENGTVLKQKMGNYELYNELYQNLDENLFDFLSLFEKLNSEKTIIENTNSEKIYIYNQNNYKYEIITNKEYITKINISNQEISYTFSFNYH